MYKVFVLSTVQGYAHAEVRRNGEFLTSARGATTAQALRTVKRNVRIARHAGEFASVDWTLRLGELIARSQRREGSIATEDVRELTELAARALAQVSETTAACST